MSLINVAPDPVGIGIFALVILLVIGFIFLVVAGLVFFLWYRKRGLRHAEIIRPATPLPAAEPLQANNPNQP